MERIVIQRGNIYNIPLYFTDEDDNPFDITGTTIFFTVKERNDFSGNDNAAVIKIDIAVHTDPTNGESNLPLSAADTNVPAKLYKGDYRIYQAGVLKANTDEFEVEVVYTVTERTS
mgnify:CR=1 FL=1